MLYSISDDDTHDTLADDLSEAEALDWLRGHCHPYTLYVTAWDPEHPNPDGTPELVAQINAEEFIDDPSSIHHVGAW